MQIKPSRSAQLSTQLKRLDYTHISWCSATNANSIALRRKWSFANAETEGWILSSVILV